MNEIMERGFQYITELPPLIVNIGVILGILAVLIPLCLFFVRKIKRRYAYWVKWGKHFKKSSPEDRIDHIMASLDNGTSEVIVEERVTKGDNSNE
ncbi:MAG: hypothetical protein FWH17_06380 [Oscillospiraceae bacterium]|nr:hypothetical protein [Oscillospiraceae bacterium]